MSDGSVISLEVARVRVWCIIMINTKQECTYEEETTSKKTSQLLKYIPALTVAIIVECSSEYTAHLVEASCGTQGRARNGRSWWRCAEQVQQVE